MTPASANTTPRFTVPEPAAAPAHTTVITTDEPVEVTVSPAPSGRWFKLWHALIESGAWARMSPSASKVYVTLARYANGHPDLACWPSVATLERESGLSRSAVYQAIAELVSAGHVVRRLTGGGATTTTYQLVAPGGVSPSVAPPDVPAQRLTRPPRRTAPPHPSASVDGYPSATVDTPVRQAGPHLDLGIRNSSSSCRVAVQSQEADDAGAVGLLQAEGYSESDIRRLATHGLERIRTAIANCDNLQRRKKLRSDRRAYIARAIADGYTLLESAERDLWPAAAERLIAKLRLVCDDDDFDALTAKYTNSLGPLRARAVSVADIDAMAPSDLLHRLLNRGRG